MHISNTAKCEISYDAKTHPTGAPPWQTDMSRVGLSLREPEADDFGSSSDVELLLGEFRGGQRRMHSRNVGDAVGRNVGADIAIDDVTIDNPDILFLHMR